MTRDIMAEIQERRRRKSQEASKLMDRLLRAMGPKLETSSEHLEGEARERLTPKVRLSEIANARRNS